MRRLTFALWFVMMALLAVVPVMAQDATPEPTEEMVTEDLTLADVIAGDNTFSTLYLALGEAGLLDTLSGEDMYTVFAPTDEAFDAALAALSLPAEDLLADTDLLTEILLYHVVPGELDAAAIQELADEGDGQTYLTTAQGGQILVNVTADGIFLNGDPISEGVEGVQVITPDVRASNGVLHAISGVLLPPEDTTADTFFIRFAHFVPDAPPVEVYINGELSAIQVLEYPVSTGWIELPFGTYDIAFVPVGDTLENAVLREELSFAVNSWITLPLIGSLEDGQVTFTIVGHDYETPIPDGQARLVLLHALYEGPVVDVFIDDSLLINSLAFPGALGDNDGAYLFDVNAATYDITVTLGGDTVFDPNATEDPTATEEAEATPEMTPEATEDGVEVLDDTDDGDRVLLTLPEFVFAENTSYFIVISGTPQEPSVFVEIQPIAEIAAFLPYEVEVEEEATPEATPETDATEEAEATNTDTIFGALDADGRFTTLIAALGSEELPETLAMIDEDDFTLFAPTDEAFAAFDMSALDGDMDGTRNLLLYHFASGNLSADDIAAMETVATRAGLNLLITTDDTGILLNNQARVIDTIETENGTIHVIDAVLNPEGGL